MEWLSTKSLHHPYWIAMSCISVGILIGFVAECVGLTGYSGRMGALTVALGVVTFGATAADLLIRSQVGRLGDVNGDLPYPYNRANLSNVMKMQTLVVVIGTIQWGFGDILGELIC